jgi:hypothetical protein
MNEEINSCIIDEKLYVNKVHMISLDVDIAAYKFYGG